MSTCETGQVTGTASKDYHIIWYTEHCLDNTLRLETFTQDADRSGDSAARGVLPQGPGRQP